MGIGRNFFIEPVELADQLGSDGLSIVDASWYLPAQGRDAKAEYMASRIPGAVYFDIDGICDPASDLPHMLPTPQKFAELVSALGLSDTDRIVVYDGPGVFSAARAWWMLRTMGAANVRLLAGGFDRWKESGHLVEAGAPPARKPGKFQPAFDDSRVVGIDEMRRLVEAQNTVILDARASARFAGEAPEPRAGLRSGHMPGAHSLPFDQLLDGGKLKNVVDLKQIFKPILQSKQSAVTTCGSGVTAAVISLALETIGHEDHRLYDGSWSEWGGLPDTPVE